MPEAIGIFFCHELSARRPLFTTYTQVVNTNYCGKVNKAWLYVCSLTNKTRTTTTVWSKEDLRP